jgi:hypothetical protein
MTKPKFLLGIEEDQQELEQMEYFEKRKTVSHSTSPFETHGVRHPLSRLRGKFPHERSSASPYCSRGSRTWF